MNVKINDLVVVITGKDAGKQGRVIATSPKSGRVTVEGVNIQKKTKKARKANETSQIAEQEGAIDVSNVMVLCDACSKAIRVKYSVQDGKKVRVCPKCGATLDKAYAGKGKKAETAKEAPKKRTRKRAAKQTEAEVAETAPTEESES